MSDPLDSASDYVATLFAKGSPLLVPGCDDIIECPAADCGAPCNPSDIFDDGTCRYCGEVIKLPEVKP
jgi:hypothetical protein